MVTPNYPRVHRGKPCTAGYSRVLVQRAEEELANPVHGGVRCCSLAAMESEFAGMPAHCAEKLARVLWPADDLGVEMEAVE